MADEKRIIEVQIKEKGIDELNQSLNKTQQELRETSVQAEKADAKLEDVGKNGGAIATLDRLTGGLASQIRDAAEASKLFNLNLKATRTALIATGVGAFAVALGLIVAYWDEIVDFIKQTNKLLEQQITISQKNQEALTTEIGLLEKQIKLEQLRGKNADDLIEKKDELLTKQANELRREIALLDIQRQRLLLRAQEVTFFERIAGFATRGIGGAVSGSLGDFDALSGVQGRIDEARGALADVLIARQEGRNAAQGGEGTFTRDPISPLTGLSTDEVKLVLDNEVKAVFDATELQITAASRLAQITIELEEKKAMARRAALADSADALMAWGNLVGQSTGAGKALALAGAAINTGLAITEILKTPSTLPEPFATISRIANIATATATGIAAARDIASVQVPGVSLDDGGLARGRNTSVAAPQAPAFNIVGDPGINQLNDAIREQTGEPLRAYVVSDDIRTQDELDRTIRASATL